MRGSRASAQLMLVLVGRCREKAVIMRKPHSIWPNTTDGESGSRMDHSHSAEAPGEQATDALSERERGCGRWSEVVLCSTAIVSAFLKY
jgi:hypothetical protein